MSIRIVTDSTCDLPEAVINKYGITVVPLYINIGSKGYLDGVEITRAQFYENLPNYDTHPTTAVPSTESFRGIYDQLAVNGASQILSIHISEGLSGTVNVARVAAEETTTVPVTVLDSRQLSLGTGFQVETAAKAVSEGSKLEHILELLEDQIKRTYVFAALDTLEFLRRSGRMSTALAAFGNLIRLKPLLRMYDGESTAERVRTSLRSTQRLVELLKEAAPLERVALVHTHARERATQLLDHVRHLLPAGEIPSVDITPVIGANIGPGAVGFACIAAKKP